MIILLFFLCSKVMAFFLTLQEHNLSRNEKCRNLQSLRIYCRHCNQRIIQKRGKSFDCEETREASHVEDLLDLGLHTYELHLTFA